ncbi:unnamed protein product [Psylliodes chrysocephalus]|uniref:Uncharacterized protein n=1 Tax=Psylliodes chrysocephalus TaxID=3402493 RepID=A0A9P0CSK0_9CUCU|nr:unnamed protein product [Psylliodes chrysocephala]
MYGVLVIAGSEHFVVNYYGQMISDACENFYSELTRCPWYYWDKRNRSILQMLLNASKTPFEISCYGLSELGFPLLLKGIRFCYTLFALVKKF